MPPLVTPQSPLSSSSGLIGGPHILLMCIGHFVLFTDRIVLFLKFFYVFQGP